MFAFEIRNPLVPFTVGLSRKLKVLKSQTSIFASLSSIGNVPRLEAFIDVP